MATVDNAGATLCPILAALQDPAPLAPPPACQRTFGPTTASDHIAALPRVWPQVLERKVGVTAGTRTESILARSQKGTTTQTRGGVDDSPPRSSSGALQTCSRSAVAPVVAEQHSPGGSVANSVLWGESNPHSILSVARTSSGRVWYMVWRQRSTRNAEVSSSIRQTSSQDALCCLPPRTAAQLA